MEVGLGCFPWARSGAEAFPRDQKWAGGASSGLEVGPKEPPVGCTGLVVPLVGQMWAAGASGGPEVGRVRLRWAGTGMWVPPVGQNWAGSTSGGLELGRGSIPNVTTAAPTSPWQPQRYRGNPSVTITMLPPPLRQLCHHCPDCIVPVDLYLCYLVKLSLG